MFVRVFFYMLLGKNWLKNGFYFLKKKKTICPYFPTTIMVTEIWADR
jgi:hypothetical protein